MRRRRVMTAGGSTGPINVTPLIDVVMVLIVFYLIVGKLAADLRSGVDLPLSSEGEESPAAGSIVVNITVPDDGAGGAEAWLGAEVVVDGITAESEAALERVVRARLAEDPSARVQVRASRRLAYASVEPALRAISRGGARGVELAAERR